MSPRDWTTTAAKYGAAFALGAASLGGMAWSLSSRKPAVVHRQAEPERREVAAQIEMPPPPRVESQTESLVLAAAPKIVLPHADELKPEVTPPERPAALTAAHKVNLNTATQAELELLPGIGPAMAQRILEFRAAKGKFSSVEQLDDVKGIGQKTLARLRPLVSVE